MSNAGMLGAFEELVLLAVARESGQAYGMTVRREIEARSGRSVSVGAVYATLDRMESKGLVSSHFQEGGRERGQRARRFFSLLPAGAQALLRTRQVHDRMWEGMDPSELFERSGGGT